jgi:hypothetical protein
MNSNYKNRFSQTKPVFRGLFLPEQEASLAGYAALIEAYDLAVPLPDKLSAISRKHSRYEKECWRILTLRHKPEATLGAHLTFALRYEGVDLAVLKVLFQTISPSEIEKVVRTTPTGKYSRRLWFLYEWLLDRRLNLPDTTVTNYVDALDPRLQYPGPSTPSKRHRVRNNFPGVKGFCPLIRRTKKLDALIEAGLDKKVKETLGSVHPYILARTAAFLLLDDSNASFAIEGERPSHTRAERWGRAIGQAGRRKLTREECLRLQEIVIQDQRFMKMGWREQGGFVGVHDRIGNTPLPDHISARWQDTGLLIDGLIAMNNRLSNSDYNPVLAATLIAFGFVFIHPFEDGNGRIHRYLIHHVLAAGEFAPRGFIFPVSAAILERIDAYRRTLEVFSKPRLELIEWKPTPSGNVAVLNETIDLYRYFDATRQAEFLYDCVRRTVEKTLPEEIVYLTCHDRMKAFVDEHFDMPDKVSENLIAFLRQGGGKLSKRARKKEFGALTDEEARMLEDRFAAVFKTPSS